MVSLWGLKRDVSVIRRASQSYRYCQQHNHYHHGHRRLMCRILVIFVRVLCFVLEPTDSVGRVVCYVMWKKWRESEMTRTVNELQHERVNFAEPLDCWGILMCVVGLTPRSEQRHFLPFLVMEMAWLSRWWHLSYILYSWALTLTCWDACAVTNNAIRDSILIFLCICETKREKRNELNWLNWVVSLKS